MAFEDDAPENAPEPSDLQPSLPPKTPRREPLYLLVLGIFLFIGLLGLTWYRADERRESGVPVMSAMNARMSTQFVQTLRYWQLNDAISPQLRAMAKPARQAEEAARQWIAVRKASDDKQYQAYVSLNAAALYGVAGHNAAARIALRRAAQLQPADAKVYRSLLPLYQQPPRQVDFSPQTERILRKISAGPLIRSHNFVLAGEKQAAARVLARGARAGLRTMAVSGITALFVLGVFTAALIVFMVKFRTIVTEVRETSQMSPPSLPWGIGTALIVVSLHHFLSNGIGLLLVMAVHAHPGGEMNAAVFLLVPLSIILSAVILLGAFLLLLGRRPWEWRVFGWHPNWHAVGYGLLSLLLILPVFWIVAFISSRLFNGENDPNPLIPVLLGTSNPWLLLFFVLTAAVMAPLVEETFYRGILFRALGERLPFWGAVVISGLLFALVHGQLAGILPIAVLGIGFAFLAWRTQGLVASAVAHGVYNGMVTLMVLLLAWASRV